MQSFISSTLERGKLYLIPVPISSRELDWVLPSAVQSNIANISHFIVEHPKTARQFLKQINTTLPLQAIDLQVLNEHTCLRDLETLLQPLLLGHDMGLVSEAGCPAIADPGAELVRMAHQKKITVIPLVGPSSILLALMASGLNGQCFAFNGYLPTDKHEREEKIRKLERISIDQKQTQIFIEAPYRNQKVLEQLVATCQVDTELCIASHLTSMEEWIVTRPIREWRSIALPDINKIPTIFLLQG